MRRLPESWRFHRRVLAPMLKRHWGILLALVFAAAGASALYVLLEPSEPNLPDYRYGGPERHYQPGGTRCQPVALAAIADRRQAEIERERCAENAEDHRLKSDDLIQQTRAADASQAQARLGYEMAWMGVYGTTGGFLTLLAATAAAFYAREAARAGKDSLDHARSVSHTELRPWIKMSVDPNWVGSDHEKLAISCIVTLENVGRMPAQNVKLGHRILNEDLSFAGSGAISLDVPDNGMRGWPPILPGDKVEGQELVFLSWEHGRRTNADGETPVKALSPFIGFNVTYDLGNGETGRTAWSFWINVIGDSGERESFSSDHEGMIRNLKAKPGFASCIA